VRGILLKPVLVVNTNFSGVPNTNQHPDGQRKHV
jgi:hypothetical protein